MDSSLRRLACSPLGRRMASGAVWSLAGASASRGLALLAGVAAARLLGRACFGELAMVQSSVNLFGAFAGFGLGLTATKHVSELRASDPARAGRIVVLSSLVSLATGGVAAAVLALGAERLAKEALGAPALAGLLRVSAPTVLFGAWAGAQTGALAGFEAFRRVARAQLAAGAVAVPLVVGGAWVGGLAGAVWGAALASLAACAFNSAELRAEMRAAGVPAVWSGLRAEGRVLWSFSVPAALGAAMIGPVNWACNAILVQRPGGFAEMGMLHAAYQWRTAMVFIPATVEAMLLPVLSSLQSAGDGRSYRKALAANLGINAALSVAAAAAVACAAGAIMRSYGPGFERGAPALVWMAASVVVSAPLTVLAQAIVSSGSMWWSFAINASWGAVLLAATTRLVGRGALGIAQASFLAYAAQLAATSVYVWAVLWRREAEGPLIDRWSDFQRPSARGLLRRSVLDGWAALDRLRGADAALERPRVHFVYLHSVFEDEEASFRALVAALSRRHRLLGYSEAVELARRGPIREPCVAFSFDDGYKNCLRAARVLEEFGASGCFFVCPAIVGETRPERIRAFCRERLRTRPVDVLSWDDLGALREAGHEIGSHTLTHARLAALDAGALQEELEASKAALEARLGRVRHFAWPFGRFSDGHAGLAAAAARAGYESCASAERGCHAAPSGAPGPLCLRREHLVAGWPLSHARFFLARGARRASAHMNRWPEALCG